MHGAWALSTCLKANCWHRFEPAGEIIGPYAAVFLNQLELNVSSDSALPYGNMRDAQPADGRSVAWNSNGLSMGL